MIVLSASAGLRVFMCAIFRAPLNFDWSDFCTKCRRWKPRGAHHCRQCRRCVLSMDHHCPMVSNCVGSRNLKEYMLFLWYGTAGIALALVVNAYRLFMFKFHPDQYPQSNLDPFEPPRAGVHIPQPSDFVRLVVYIWRGNGLEVVWGLAGTLLAAIALAYVGSVNYRQTRCILLGTSTIDLHADAARIKRDFEENTKAELAAIMGRRLLDVFGAEPFFWSFPTAGGCRFSAEYERLL